MEKGDGEASPTGGWDVAGVGASQLRVRPPGSLHPL